MCVSVCVWLYLCVSVSILVSMLVFFLLYFFNESSVFFVCLCMGVSPGSPKKVPRCLV